MSEARTSRLEADVDAIKGTLARLEPLIHRIDATLNATLPTLATTLELAALDVRFTGELATLREALADKPGKIYLATAIGVSLVAYTAGLAALAALPVVARLIH
jgi:hypothetical protein